MRAEQSSECARTSAQILESLHFFPRTNLSIALKLSLTQIPRVLLQNAAGFFSRMLHEWPLSSCQLKPREPDFTV